MTELTTQSEESQHKVTFNSIKRILGHKASLHFVGAQSKHVYVYVKIANNIISLY